MSMLTLQNKVLNLGYMGYVKLVFSSQLVKYISCNKMVTGEEKDEV